MSSMSNTLRRSEQRGFNTLIGQDEVRQRLTEIMSEPGAVFLLITGAEGSGKRFVAGLAAKASLCAQPDEAGACDDCDACRLFNAGNHIDFDELKPDSKTLISTQTVRESIRDLNVMPQLGQRRVILINGNLLNEQGQNALLKSLETPPPFVTFIMTANSEQSLLPTIRSRAVKLTLTARSDEAMRDILKVHGVLDDDAVRRAVAYAYGNPARALMLASDKEYPHLREQALTIFFRLPDRTAADLLGDDLEVLKHYRDNTGTGLNDVFDVWSEQLRDALAAAVGADPVSAAEGERLSRFLHAIAGKRPAADRLERCQREINRVRRALAAYASVDTALAHILLFMRKELHA